MGIEVIVVRGHLSLMDGENIPKTRLKDQAAVLMGLIFSYSAPWVCKVSHRLTSVCRPSQNSGVVAKKRARRKAVSGVRPAGPGGFHSDAPG